MGHDTVSFWDKSGGWLHAIWADAAEGRFVKIILTVVLAAFIYFVSKEWLSVLIKKIVGRTKSTWDDILYDQGFFGKLSF